jgi:hypothetical protein
MIYNENLAPNKSECIDVLGQVLQWTTYKIFSEKYEDFSNVIKNISWNHKKYEHRTQVSRYFKGIF